MPERPHLSITPVAPIHTIGTSNNAERDDSAEAAPAHWAPYADSERDDNFRKY